tara:strand:+ start:1449 stop:1784 length:336 start_codon:yes stop_codon:yes gene_type:complete
MRNNYITLSLAGRDYRLKPSFQAIMDMEERLGGVIALAIKASEGDIGLKDLTVVVWATMEERLPFAEVGELLLEAGLSHVTPAVRDLLSLCLSGGKEMASAPGKPDRGQGV